MEDVLLTSVTGGYEWPSSLPAHFTTVGGVRYPLHRRLYGPRNLSGRCPAVSTGLH